MNHTEILLDDNTSNEEKFLIANEIINTYNLSLKVRQILFVHERIQYYVNLKNIVTPNKLKYNRIFLLNNILNTNTNMYHSIILALCDDFHPCDLGDLMILDENTGLCIEVGLKNCASKYFYYKLLSYHNFDISNISTIPNEILQEIEEYRQRKYSGKLTKKAIKND